MTCLSCERKEYLDVKANLQNCQILHRHEIEGVYMRKEQSVIVIENYGGKRGKGSQ